VAAAWSSCAGYDGRWRGEVRGDADGDGIDLGLHLIGLAWMLSGILGTQIGFVRWISPDGSRDESYRLVG